MECGTCGHSYQARNQHDSCPACQAKTGTPEDRDLVDEHREKVAWFEAYEEATQQARENAYKCADYYDGKQWTPKQEEELATRSQAPTVVNLIFKKLNYLFGTEINTRSDPKALPRTPTHEEDVEAITDALRFVVDSEDFDKTASDAWEEKLKKGCAAAVVEVEPDGDDIAIKIRGVPYDRFFYDPHSLKADFSDAKYLGVSTWWDVEEAADWFESQAGVADNARELLSESILHYGENEAHSDKPSAWHDPEHRTRVRTTETYYKKKGIWYVCFASKAGFLIPPKPTGYKDEKGRDVCPLVADSAYIDREGNRYGLVHHMIGPQDEINKRRSKALHWLSVDRMIAEKGAFLDPDGAQTEYAKPDGWLQAEDGAMAAQRFQIVDGTTKAQGMFQMLDRSQAEIHMVGPDAPQIGTMTGEQSGRALMARQQIGNLELARPLDNHRRWKRTIYRHVWYRVRQFWPGEKWMRVRDDAENTGWRFVGLNRKLTRGQRLQELLGKQVPPESALKAAGIPPKLMQEAITIAQAQAQGAPPEQLQQVAVSLLMRHPITEQPITAADTAALDVDVILDESPDAAILQTEEFADFMRTLPALLQADQANAKEYLAVGLELSSSRHKKKALAILRKPPDPKQQQAQQMGQQMQMAGAQAQLQLAQAQAQKEQAQAAKTAAEAQKIPVSAQKDAAEAQKTATETQLNLPAQAHRDHAAAAKSEAEAQPEVLLALQAPGPRRPF